MLPTKFRFNWLSSFREEDFQKSTNQKQEWPVADMCVNESVFPKVFYFLQDIWSCKPAKFTWPEDNLPDQNLLV
jgi:hypothetical protein